MNTYSITSLNAYGRLFNGIPISGLSAVKIDDEIIVIDMERKIDLGIITLNKKPGNYASVELNTEANADAVNYFRDIVEAAIE